jgi:hypothetical protein
MNPCCFPLFDTTGACKQSLPPLLTLAKEIVATPIGSLLMTPHLSPGEEKQELR